MREMRAAIQRNKKINEEGGGVIVRYKKTK